MQKTKIPNKKPAKKEAGFSLIEMLVVVVIFAVTFIALSSIMKVMIISSHQARKIQTAKAEAQEATQYFTKLTKMAKLESSGSTAIQLRWRKPQGKTYQEVLDTINEAFIQNFFSEADVENLRFVASGDSSNNRITIVFDIVIDAGSSGEDVIIPFQTTVALRNYEVE